MATKEKTTKQRKTQQTHDLSNAHNTFEYSTNTTAVEEKLFGGNQEDEEPDDGPLVFICAKCKIPVGDSLSWDGSEDGQSQIRLKRVTDNVVVGEDARLLEASKKKICLIVDLICKGCHSVLGMVYESTPKSLDHKRNTFCFNVGSIDSYVLGSASQLLAAEGSKELPVTLEYRGVVEQQLTEMKLLVLSMAQKLEDMELSRQEGCDKE